MDLDDYRNYICMLTVFTYYQLVKTICDYYLLENFIENLHNSIIAASLLIASQYAIYSALFSFMIYTREKKNRRNIAYYCKNIIKHTLFSAFSVSSLYFLFPNKAFRFSTTQVRLVSIILPTAIFAKHDKHFMRIACSIVIISNQLYFEEQPFNTGSKPSLVTPNPTP